MKVLIVQKSQGGVIDFGMKKVLAALEAVGCTVQTAHHWQGTDCDAVLCIGETAVPYIRRHLQAEEQDLYVPETVFLRTLEGAPVLVVAGSDAVGLCYALLELEERIRARGAEVLLEGMAILYHPDNRVRAVSRFVMSRRDDGWFYSQEFWEYYCARLLTCRFNRFTLIVGFDTAYLSPPYPFLLDVPGYPGVNGTDHSATPEGRQRNLAMLRRIGAICHSYGLAFEFATWQQTPWTAGQQSLVRGLPADENVLGDYCAAGLRELVSRCPEIDMVQLRVNFEAGVGDQVTNDAFWKKQILALSQADRCVGLTLRAKGLTPALIAYAQRLGLDLSVATKYWCEHMALPHHMTVMRGEERARIQNYNHSRRYSYADLITRLFFYRMVYRLWNYGSNTLFLWADTDYVRRFSRSIADGDGDGFEVTAPLTLKGGMSSVAGEDWPMFRDPALRSGRWEDERYWAWYMCFGRIGYSGKTSDNAIAREFLRHFGPAGEHMETALAAASKIMPLITTFHMPQHPSLQYWPEICTGAALFARHNHVAEYGDVSYGSALPSDEELFCSVDDYVAAREKGTPLEKYSPLQACEWLTDFAAQARTALEQYGAATEEPTAEALAAATDIRMLCALAEYHAWKTAAAESLARHRLTGEGKHLARALSALRKAVGCWNLLIETGKAYHDQMDFKAGSLTGKGKTGAWKDRLPELEADLAALEAMAEGIPAAEAVLGSHPLRAEFGADVPRRHPAGEDLRVTVTLSPLAGLGDGLTLRYRRMNHLEGLFRELPMERDGDTFRAVIPGEYIDRRWNLMLYFSGVRENGDALLYPGVYSPASPSPYYVIETDSPR